MHLPLPLAALSGTQAAFYATAITAIPVLLVVAFVGRVALPSGIANLRKGWQLAWRLWATCYLLAVSAGEVAAFVSLRNDTSSQSGIVLTDVGFALALIVFAWRGIQYIWWSKPRHETNARITAPASHDLVVPKGRTPDAPT